jgi:hypothetical protein
VGDVDCGHEPARGYAVGIFVQNDRFVVEVEADQKRIGFDFNVTRQQPAVG